MLKLTTNKYSIFLLVFLLTLAPNTLRSEEESNTQVTVFCTNNKDGTGSCLTSTQDPVECVLVPGSVVECNDANENELICVSVHATSAIVEISCEKPIAESNRTVRNKNPDTSKINTYQSDNDEIIDSGELESKSETPVITSDQKITEDSVDSPFTDPF